MILPPNAHRRRCGVSWAMLGTLPERSSSCDSPPDFPFSSSFGRGAKPRSCKSFRCRSGIGGEHQAWHRRRRCERAKGLWADRSSRWDLMPEGLPPGRVFGGMGAV